MFLRLILLLIFSTSIFLAFPNEKMLLEGDSLFANQKYTEAFQAYKELFSGGEYSASMLLKMAFIRDGLGNYSDALYYLDLYYKKSADRSVVGKIEALSKEENLVGYTYDDLHFFKVTIIKYKNQIRLIIMSTVILLTVYIFRKKKQQEKPLVALIFQTVLFACLFLISNDLFTVNQGIIREDNTLLRSGPSAGAEPIEVINKGHKVDIVERTPVWTKIDWQGEDVFVRNGRIKAI